MDNNSAPLEHWAIGEVRLEDGRPAEVSIQQTNAGYRMDAFRMDVAEVVALLRQGHRVYAIWHETDGPAMADLKITVADDGSENIEVAASEGARKIATLPGFPDPVWLGVPSLHVLSKKDLG